jgi:hypothetical protein
MPMLGAALVMVAALSVLGAGASGAAAAQRQTITFTSSAPTSATVGGPAYHVSVVASSGLAVTLTIDASSRAVCTVSGSAVTFIGVGTCSIDANQPGGGQFGSNEYVEPYNAASQAQQSFAVRPPPDSHFTAGASSFNPATGMVTFIESIKDPGAFTWLLTIPNGKFGVYASRSKCKAGYLRIAGRCRRSTVIFATGSAVVPAGVVIFKLRPSPSTLKALKVALKRNKGIRVTATFTFQSSRGGSPISHTQRIIDRLKRK